MPKHLDQLPIEIISEIAKYLTFWDRYSLALTCRKFNPLLTKQDWQRILRAKGLDRVEALIEEDVQRHGEVFPIIPDEEPTKRAVRGMQHLYGDTLSKQIVALQNYSILNNTRSEIPTAKREKEQKAKEITLASLCLAIGCIGVCLTILFGVSLLFFASQVIGDSDNQDEIEIDINFLLMILLTIPMYLTFLCAGFGCCVFWANDSDPVCGISTQTSVQDYIKGRSKVIELQEFAATSEQERQRLLEHGDMPKDHNYGALQI